MPAVFLFAPTPNLAASEFIASKPAVSRAVFDRLLPELKARAFTITGIQGADVLQACRDAIATLPQGGDWEDIKAQLVGKISPYFVDDTAPEEDQAKQQQAADRRAELLLRTHGQQAYAAAQFGMLNEQKEVFPYWQYMTLGDSHVRPTHAALDGVVLPADHEFWQTHFPPWEWGCRCQLIPLSRYDTAKMAEKQKDKPADQQDVLSDYAQQDLTASRRLVRNGVTYNMTAPREEGKPGAYAFHPGDLRITPDQLKARYDADIFDTFSKWAQNHKLDGLENEHGAKASVWDWMQGMSAPIAATPVTVPGPFTPATPGARIPTHPNRSPVGKALTVGGPPALVKMLQEAIAEMNFVHDDGVLPPAVIGELSGGSNLGEYHPRTNAIGVRPSGAWPRLTACHEVGHFLDNRALGFNGQWASVSHPDLQAWRDAVDASQATWQIKFGLMVPNRAYWQTRWEQWARSYAQYIAEKSGDPALLADLNRVMSSGFRGRQWGTHDFAPIRAAIDELFKKKGWI